MNLPDLIPYDPDNLDAVLLNRVERGVAFLDAIDPAWRSFVDPETLRIQSACNCIRGQLADLDPEWTEIEDAIIEYAAVDPETEPGVEDVLDYPYSLGLEAPYCIYPGDHGIGVEYDRLNKFWRRAVKLEGEFEPTEFPDIRPEGYFTLEDWARDSDFTFWPEAGGWTQDDDPERNLVDLPECYAAAMEAAGS